MATGYQRNINAAGLAHIHNLLGQYHKLGRAHFTKDMLHAWAQEVEQNLADDGQAFFEIPAHNSINGRTQVLRFDRLEVAKYTDLQLYTCQWLKNGPGIEDVIDQICHGMTVEMAVDQVTHHVTEIEFTGEHLAGQYAYQLALKRGLGTDDAVISAQIDFLEAQGAQFDRTWATKIAHAFVDQGSKAA